MSDTHLSAEEYRRRMGLDVAKATTVDAPVNHPVAPQKRSKYGAIKTEYNGRIYDSKKEAEYAARLDARVAAGEIKAWIPQVSFPLTASRYFADFLVINTDRTFELIDIKGYDKESGKFRDTSNSKLKRKEMKKLYNIDIIVL